MNHASRDDIVYMDPPYQGVCSTRDTRYYNGISFDEFVNALAFLNDKGISYIVSYDGRTGSKTYGKILPESLGLKHIEVMAGRSSQSTLLGRNHFTYESIYVSPSLSAEIDYSAFGSHVSEPSTVTAGSING